MHITLDSLQCLWPCAYNAIKLPTVLVIFFIKFYQVSHVCVLC